MPIIDFFLHLDAHMEALIRDYGVWTYAILAATIFGETGFVFLPFLPGDSLLFAAGIFTGDGPGQLNVYLLFVLLVAAAFAGDNVNYHVGRVFGEKLFRNEDSRFFKRSHLDRTHEFFKRYGAKTIIIARFVPVVRTMTPFVAGMGKMSYRLFLLYSIVAAIIWVGVCLFAGHFFGRLQIVRDNFGIGILAIVAVSVLPMVVEFIKHRRRAGSDANEDAA